MKFLTPSELRSIASLIESLDKLSNIRVSVEVYVVGDEDERVGRISNETGTHAFYFDEGPVNYRLTQG